MVHLGNGTSVKMSSITQKDLYEDAIYRISRPHAYEIKWIEKLNTVFIIEEVWDSVHNFLSSNKTKTVIWEQIHLNFYTQYSYNKWHGTNDACPLCNKIPESIYHILLHCQFVNIVWGLIQPTLIKFYPNPVTDSEKALGIIHIRKTPEMIIRNWLTYRMREQIMNYERIAYHSPTNASIDRFKTEFNRAVAYDIKKLMIRFDHEGKTEKFEKYVAYGNILCYKNRNGNYQANKVFP